MTSQHFDPSELDRADPELEEVAARLERYSGESPDVPPIDLVSRVQAAVDAEPAPSRSWWTAFLRAARGPARAVAVASVLVAAIVGALAVTQLADLTRPDVGSSPVPPFASPTPTPSTSPTPSPTPTASPSPSATPTTEAATATPAAVVPSPTEDDDELETPEPSESDDSSGPGSGDDDDSSGSGSDNSGSGGSGSDD